MFFNELLTHLPSQHFSQVDENRNAGLQTRARREL